MTGGDITCIESTEGAEVFGEEIKHVLKLAVLNVTVTQQFHMCKLVTPPSWPVQWQIKHKKGFSFMISTQMMSELENNANTTICNLKLVAWIPDKTLFVNMYERWFSFQENSYTILEETLNEITVHISASQTLLVALK